VIRDERTHWGESGKVKQRDHPLLEWVIKTRGMETGGLVGGMSARRTRAQRAEKSGQGWEGGAGCQGKREGEGS